MVVAIVPGMGIVLEGRDQLEKEFSSKKEGEEVGITFLPSSSSDDKDKDEEKVEKSDDSDNGVLEELESMNALDIGLYKLLKQHFGIEFTGIIGLSASEPCGLALAVGTEAAIQSELQCTTKICAELYQQLEGKGSMLVVFDIPKEDIIQAIAGTDSTTAGIGAWFGAKAGAITGNAKDMEAIQQLAVDKGWKHLTPKVGYGDRIPFHCPALFEPYRTATMEKLKESSSGGDDQGHDGDFTERFSIPYYSSYTGGKVTTAASSSSANNNGFPEFLFNSMAEPAVSFEAIRACVRDGHRRFVELNLKPLYVRTVEEAFVAEGIPIEECKVYCCAPSRSEMEDLAKKLL